MYKLSFIVDHHPLLYYQAELLLFSLARFASHPKEHILIHCTNRVNEAFLSFLKTNGYSFKIIEPFLDGKYCNKLKQLESFYEEDDCEGVFLLDTDVFLLEPISPPDPGSFCAKVVDGPNPSLENLKSIFDAAGLSHDNIIETDWYEGISTYSCNFNGGYYYIPRKQIITISEGWKKWATWLFARPELFGSASLAIHTDQVAMALAVSEARIEFVNVPSNYNCPIHYSDTLKYFDPEKPVSLLHYHSEINIFGLLNDSKAGNQAIKAAIAKANAAIAHHHSFAFYKDFRKSLVRPLEATERTAQFFDELSKLTIAHGKKLRLILHAGTPKTGTTSMQFFLRQHQEELKKSGYLYPEVYINTYAPKHQWLVTALMDTNIKMLIDYFSKVFEQLREDTHTILLSTEGLYNHWNDYTAEAKVVFEVLSKLFDLECWIWFREPNSFIKSLYRQNLKNPQIVKQCYGRDLSMVEMLEDPWFRGHLDYLGFICGWESITGEEKLKIFSHTGDILSTVKSQLGLDPSLNLEKRENIGLSDATTELLRVVNRYPLSIEEKEQCVDLLKGIDKILSSYAPTKSEDREAAAIIQECTAIQRRILTSDYQLIL